VSAAASTPPRTVPTSPRVRIAALVVVNVIGALAFLWPFVVAVTPGSDANHHADAPLVLCLVLLGIGGVIFPLARFPAGVRTVLLLLPSGALSDGLRSVLSGIPGSPLRDIAVLAIWAAAAIALAARTFRWE